jgi:hypothetical protein
MTAAEILHAARAGGLIETAGKTPVKTLNARLSVDILRFKLASLFMRSDGSRFALRDWSASVQERIVPRRSIALVDGNRSHPQAFQAAGFAGIMGSVRLARAAAMRLQA